MVHPEFACIFFLVVVICLLIFKVFYLLLKFFRKFNIHLLHSATPIKKRTILSVKIPICQ